LVKVPINIPYQSKKHKKNKRNAKSGSDGSEIFKWLFFGLLFVVITGVGLYVYDQKRGLPEVPTIQEIIARVKGAKNENNNEKTIFCIDSELPEHLRDDVRPWAQTLDGDVDIKTKSASQLSEEECSLALSHKDLGGYDLAWKKYYAAVTARESSLSGITSDEFQQMIGGTPITKNGGEYSLVVSKYAKNFLENRFGVGVTVQFVENVAATIGEDTSLVGIVPFEDVNYELRVIEVNDVYLFDPELGADDSYFLTEEVWVKEEENLGLFSLVRNSMGSINFQPDKISTVVVTGTSVMGARGLYQKIIETEDPIYPIRDIAPILQQADIAHVSNEAAFAEDCVQYQGTLSFCGTNESFEAFTYAGVDAVGLTGNHILDAGVDYFLETLDMYTDSGIKYFGGGRDLADASKPAVFEVNGMQIAFLGYNAIPPATYFATENSPGSLEMNKRRMIQDISDAAKNYDYVFVDMQWGPEYQHTPIAYQVEYGHAAVDAGADFVTGVHPHWVQPVEYYGDGLIFYSLGNLLFDQMWSQKTREGVMIKHIFYEQEYMGFEIIPTMIFEGAQPRVVDGEDALRIRNYVFGIY
jgi:poly-gamma-glutamate capsule biosynthesis protein CapA/YwtB (metallophosphatase superfamily)